jgi:hypothetical protein
MVEVRTAMRIKAVWRFILEKVTYNEHEAKGGRKLVCARLKFDEKDSRHDAKCHPGSDSGFVKLVVLQS